MGKRQRRFFFQKDIEHEMPLLVGHIVQVILRHGQVLTGRLQRMEQGVLFLQDGRHHVHHLPLLDVEEVVLDLVAEY
ncbi:hypothetical protein [Nibribacter koreensis]|uniref:Rho-binding antiterminator n=1 Tax=Nibribacter koreensis TaxID=1084519 RepID=A0ABP8G1J5_9BACT